MQLAASRKNKPFVARSVPALGDWDGTTSLRTTRADADYHGEPPLPMKCAKVGRRAAKRAV